MPVVNRQANWLRFTSVSILKKTCFDCSFFFFFSYRLPLLNWTPTLASRRQPARTRHEMPLVNGSVMRPSASKVGTFPAPCGYIPRHWNLTLTIIFCTEIVPPCTVGSENTKKLYKTPSKLENWIQIGTKLIIGKESHCRFVHSHKATKHIHTTVEFIMGLSKGN